MSTHASSSRAFSHRVASDGRSGALAALVVLFLDLLWRVTLAPTGAPSIPESVVAAVARLTPTAVLGWATESFGSLAQNTLWTIVLVGVVGIGYWAGQVAGQLVRLGRFGTGTTGRLGAGIVMAAVLFLIIAAGIFPLAREGFFAAASVNQGALLVQAVLFAAVWAVAWTAIGGAPLPAPEPEAAPAATDASISRRSALRSVAAAGLAAGVAYLGWRLAKAPSAGDVEARQQAAAEIAARARGGAPAAGAAPVTSAGAESPDLAPVAPDDALAQWDPSPEEPFAELETEGKLTPVITSVADFYHVSKNISDPVVDGASWSLTIDGLVATPLSFSYEDIVARAKTQNITTLSCISNELNGDLAGTAEWTGLPLRELLEEAGVDPKAVDIVFRAADGYDDSIPLAQAMHPTTLLVTGMNGEPLPPDHGFPARLIVPPIYGMKNVKWVERIEAVDHDYQGYWQTRGWSDPAPYQIWGRIDTPAQGEQIPAGPAVAAGVAAAGNRGIYRVEISLDEGQTWADATLEPSINPDFTWVRWVFPFEATGPATNILMRATDGEGNVAPEEYNPPLPDGATGWPQRSVRVG
ncbi:MAG TPA: molybdopterin-dependent oxidoreductase [Thermomicrobiales bacterium]|nr:molybdopterin-dependent oxidoreductase [Thermomicrobiales bacterium]